MRRHLSKEELAEIKFESIQSWLDKGNAITVLKPYKPEVKTCFGRNKDHMKPKRKGVMK